MTEKRILKPAESKYTIPGYFGCVMDLYNESHIYAPALAIAKKQFPDIDFVEPALKDWNNVTWFKEWAEIVPHLGLLTILPRLDKTIGRGCYREILDAGFVGIPIYIYDYDNKIFTPFKKVIRLSFIKRSYRNFARVYFQALPENVGTDAKVPYLDRDERIGH